MTHVVTEYLPWLLSAITIWMTLLAGNTHPKAWAVGLGNQALWFTWVIVSAAWGFLPMTVALTIVYARNHFLWQQPPMSPWQRAIDESLIVSALDCTHEGESPEQALARLVQWEVEVALDPLVSRRARELIESGRKLDVQDKLDAARYRAMRNSEWEMFSDRWLVEVDVYGQQGADLDEVVDRMVDAQANPSWP